MTLTTLLLTMVVAAPMPGEAEAVAFKAAFEQGEALYRDGEYGLAIYRFKQADALKVTPEVAYDLAKAYEKVGDAPMRLYYYRLYMRRAPAAADTLEVAGFVGEGLSQAETNGQGYLELNAPRAFEVTVAGFTFPEPPVALFLPPGQYSVEARFPTGVKTMLIEVRTGKTNAVVFEPLAPPLLAVEQALSKEWLARGLTGPPTGPEPLRVGSFVALGAGLASFAAGAVVGAMSNGDAGRSQDKSLTVPEAQGFADAANGKAVGANVLMGVGVAALGAGAVMFVFSMPEPGMKKSTGAGGR